MIAVSRRLAASPAAVWDAFTDLDSWSRWGPSLRGAELEGGGRRIGPAARGRVQTAVGVWLPFEVTGWEQGRSWTWTVARIPATAHFVAPAAGAADHSVATISVPAWALPYSALCWFALGRLGRVASP